MIEKFLVLLFFNSNINFNEFLHQKSETAFWNFLNLEKDKNLMKNEENCTKKGQEIFINQEVGSLGWDILSKPVKM